jgi:hypothetical protein
MASRWSSPATSQRLVLDIIEGMAAADTVGSRPLRGATDRTGHIAHRLPRAASAPLVRVYNLTTVSRTST